MPKAKTIDNRKDVLLLLLYSPGRTDSPNEPIDGRTRLTKMLFLFKEEAFKAFRAGTSINEENFYQFFPWNFGPFSRDVYDDLTFFELRGFIEKGESEEETLPEAAAEWDRWLNLSRAVSVPMSCSTSPETCSRCLASASRAVSAALRTSASRFSAPARSRLFAVGSFVALIAFSASTSATLAACMAVNAVFAAPWAGWKTGESSGPSGVWREGPCLHCGLANAPPEIDEFLTHRQARHSAT